MEALQRQGRRTITCAGPDRCFCRGIMPVYTHRHRQAAWRRLGVAPLCCPSPCPPTPAHPNPPARAGSLYGKPRSRHLINAIGSAPCPRPAPPLPPTHTRAHSNGQPLWLNSHNRPTDRPPDQRTWKNPASRLSRSSAPRCSPPSSSHCGSAPARKARQAARKPASAAASGESSPGPASSSSCCCCCCSAGLGRPVPAAAAAAWRPRRCCCSCSNAATCRAGWRVWRLLGGWLGARGGGGDGMV